MSDKVVTAKIYVGTGLQQPSDPCPATVPAGTQHPSSCMCGGSGEIPRGPAPGRYGRHRVVIDPRDVMNDVERIINKHFFASTIYKGRGQWQGLGEPSIVAELWAGADDASTFAAKLQECATELSDQIDQIAIAVVTTDINGAKAAHYFGGVHKRTPRLARKHQRKLLGRYAKHVAQLTE